MSLPKISIITPSYNQGSFIRDTIDSVLSQNYNNLEYIVVDGGSTDDTKDILKSYKKNIKWTSKKDKGQTHAINKGLKMASGDILGYLNSDDVLLPGSLKNISKYFQDNQDCHWLTGDYKIINEKNQLSNRNIIISSYKKFLLSIHSEKTLKIFNNYIPQPSTFWSKNALNKTGLFKESLSFVMDYDYWIRLSKKFKLFYLKEKLSGFRVHPVSKSESNRDKMLKEGVKIIKQHGASNTEIKLHKAHNTLIKYIYNLLKH